MFEFIFAGFTGTFLSYFIVFEGGVFCYAFFHKYYTHEFEKNQYIKITNEINESIRKNNESICKNNESLRTILLLTTGDTVAKSPQGTEVIADDSLPPQGTELPYRYPYLKWEFHSDVPYPDRDVRFQNIQKHVQLEKKIMEDNRKMNLVMGREDAETRSLLTAAKYTGPGQPYKSPMNYMMDASAQVVWGSGGTSWENCGTSWENCGTSSNPKDFISANKDDADYTGISVQNQIFKRHKIGETSW